MILDQKGGENVLPLYSKKYTRTVEELVVAVFLDIILVPGVKELLTRHAFRCAHLSLHPK